MRLESRGRSQEMICVLEAVHLLCIACNNNMLQRFRGRRLWQACRPTRVLEMLETLHEKLSHLDEASEARRPKFVMRSFVDWSKGQGRFTFVRPHVCCA